MTYTKSSDRTEMNDRLVPIPGNEKQMKCIHDYRMLNREERRHKMALKFNAKGICVNCGCLFVLPTQDLNKELVTGDAINN